MELLDLYSQISLGEDTRNQFKEEITNGNSLASEIVAFSNSKGGRIYVGINDKTHEIVGLSTEGIGRLNQLISNVSSQMVHPSVNPDTEIIGTPEGKKVVVITVPEGLSKPYSDNNGVFWVKAGSDKRKITARDELLRMFQEEDFIHADEGPVRGLMSTDIDFSYFSDVYEKIYDENLDTQELSLPQLLRNMNLVADNGYLTLTGALCFAPRVPLVRPLFIVKAVRYQSDDIDIDSYSDSRDFSGKLEDVFNGAVSFVMNNIPYAQNGQNVNSLALPAVPRIAIEELIANALVHRNYFISSPVRIFIFCNRIEIISPGVLPNSLTVENAIAGNSVSRNPILSSYARYILPYRGLGNGIRRALKLHPAIKLINDTDNDQFKAIIFFSEDKAEDSE